MQAHDFVSAGGWLIGRNPINPISLQVLDQLRTRCFILDQNLVGPMPFRQLLHLALEVGVIETLTKNVQQIIATLMGTPGRAYAVVAEFGRLIRGIPTLYD